MVKARRAWKDVQPRCITFLQWSTTVSMESTVSMLTVLSRAALTPCEGGGIALGRMEAGITQDNHAPIKLLNQSLKRVIRDMRGGTRPPHDQPPLIHHQTQCPTDNPPVIREAFAADLLGLRPSRMG